MCDQFSASALKMYGGSVETPNLNKIAAAGVVFDAAYCQTPVCSPSRASIITGQYPHKHGLVHNVNRVDYPIIGGPEGEDGINELDVTTESILHAGGYNLAHIGKWHLSGECDLSYYPNMYREHQEYGVEMQDTFHRVAMRPREEYLDWYGWKLPVTMCEEFKESTRLIPAKYMELDLYRDFYGKMGRLELPIEDNYDYRIGSKCVEFIKGAEKPFMLTCSFNLPHDPNVIPSPYYESVNNVSANSSLPCDDMYMNDLSKDIPTHAGDAFLKEFIKIYYASIKLVDDQIGRMLSALEKKGALKDTVIIFTADHGDMAGGHGMFWKSTKSFYDEIARVPLVISAPGYKPARYNKPVELVDIMPTIIDLCGFQPAGMDIDGVSLVPVLQGAESEKDTAISERLYFAPGNKRHAHSNDENAHFMLRYDKYKFILHKEGDGLTPLLFDLSKDPGEFDNLCKNPEHRELVAKLYEKLRLRLAGSGYLLQSESII